MILLGVRFGASRRECTDVALPLTLTADGVMVFFCIYQMILILLRPPCTLDRRFDCRRGEYNPRSTFVGSLRVVRVFFFVEVAAFVGFFPLVRYVFWVREAPFAKRGVGSAVFVGGVVWGCLERRNCYLYQRCLLPAVPLLRWRCLLVVRTQS